MRRNPNYVRVVRKGTTYRWVVCAANHREQLRSTTSYRHARSCRRAAQRFANSCDMRLVED